MKNKFNQLSNRVTAPHTTTLTSLHNIQKTEIIPKTTVISRFFFANDCKGTTQISKIIRYFFIEVFRIETMSRMFIFY